MYNQNSDSKLLSTFIDPSSRFLSYSGSKNIYSNSPSKNYELSLPHPYKADYTFRTYSSINPKHSQAKSVYDFLNITSLPKHGENSTSKSQQRARPTIPDHAAKPSQVNVRVLQPQPVNTSQINQEKKAKDIPLKLKQEQQDILLKDFKQDEIDELLTSIKCKEGESDESTLAKIDRQLSMLTSLRKFYQKKVSPGYGDEFLTPDQQEVTINVRSYLKDLYLKTLQLD